MTNHILFWNQDKLNLRETTTRMLLLSIQMESKCCQIMDVSNPIINRDKLTMSREETTKSQLRAWTLCVSYFNLTLTFSYSWIWICPQARSLQFYYSWKSCCCLISIRYCKIKYCWSFKESNYHKWATMCC